MIKKIIKVLLVFLTSFFVVSSPILSLTNQQIHKGLQTLGVDPTYPNINVNPNINLQTWSGGNGWNKHYNNSHSASYSFDMNSYASSASDFCNYYTTVTFEFTGVSGSSGWGRNQQVNGPVTFNLNSGTTNYFFNWSKKGSENQASNSASVNWSWNNDILTFNFSAVTWIWHGANWSWTDSTANLAVTNICFNSTFSLSQLHNSLATAFKQSVNLVSDYSGSLTDPNNINDPTGKGNDETTLINQVLKNVLASNYQYWLNDIQPFAFSDATRNATIEIKFIDGTTKQQIVWTFHVSINITLSTDYWSKSISQRLHIIPGMVVNPQDSTKGMIPDSPDIISPANPGQGSGGEMRYHNSVEVEFDGLLNNSEYVTINGNQVSVLNDKFHATLNDARINGGKNNTYDIIVYHNDGTYQKQYELKIDINQLVPNLTLKWYAWNHNSNPQQKSLITPNLPNGKPNPDYDAEINRKTGTKTQIVWIKHQSVVPTPLDPLDKNGNVIKNHNDYDLGFIAQGAVVGMGVNQTFNDANIKTVTREGVNNSLTPFFNPSSRQQNIAIASDNDNQYWSDQGIWHYVETLTDGTTAQKYVVIGGSKYDNKYPKFLNFLNNPSVAVDFWTTIHGQHLKNYLIDQYQFDSQTIASLSYEQVVSYWKQYTSDVISQKIPPDPHPSNYQNLANMFFWTIKMNENSIDNIKQETINQVQQQLTKTTLAYSYDYSLNPIDNNSLQQLLNFDNTGNATMIINISALPTSTKCVGTNHIKIINNKHYNPKTVVNLSNIKFSIQEFNFAQFTSQQLTKWILQDVKQTFNFYQINLLYQTDYGVKPLDSTTLNQFINSKKIDFLNITIYALDSSLKCINGTNLQLINNPQAPPAPPIPPTPPNPPGPPNPNPNPHGINKQNLTWIISVTCLSILVVIAIVYLVKQRKKKGIGGLRRNVK